MKKSKRLMFLLFLQFHCVWQGESGEEEKTQLLQKLEGEKKEWSALMNAAKQMDATREKNAK